MTKDSYGRWEAWIQNTRWVQGISAYAMAIAQYLGRFDALLIDGDRLADQQGVPIKDGEVDEARALADMDRHLVSYLWVLGVYELVRTVHEKFRKEEIGTPELHEDIQALHRFECRS